LTPDVSAVEKMPRRNARLERWEKWVGEGRVGEGMVGEGGCGGCVSRYTL